MEKAAAVILVGLLLGGCANWFKDDKDLPTVQLPQKPASTNVPTEDLSAQQEAACLQQDSAQARDVCRKVQKNKIIADDLQKSFDRLYEARDGK
ncbi:MAG: hypothetical protein RIC14_00020 [Filomicrobium sp.]